MDKRAMMDPSWMRLLKEEFEKPYMKELEDFLASEYQSGKTIYPPFENIFEAFCSSSYEKVKVVIVGQDPYHGPGQAHGLSFSVPDGIGMPPSLLNIFKELKSDLGIEIPNHGCLSSWAKQGVFLLNATLTVRDGEPKSHFGRGWEIFTDKVIAHLSKKKEPVVFLLWGKSAAEKVNQIEAHHLVLKAPHPSPFSAHTGFLGCKHFSKTNQFLKSKGLEPIHWEIL